ncbi:hypothetical protein M885DRAFT_524461 [Pelagophyceae sp. CCMP2097]|nr:hypothetical protein M885DRAFT_524461 [Pelagophyceae sp. CCMP2097]
MLDGLPTVVDVHIASFLGPSALCALRLVSRKWRDAAVDVLWEPLCFKLWLGKENLEGRQRPLTAIFESGNVMRIAFDHCGCSDTGDSRGGEARVLGWRESYALSRRDSRRTALSVEELCSMPFIVSFHAHQHECASEAALRGLLGEGSTFASFLNKSKSKKLKERYFDHYLRPAKWRFLPRSGNYSGDGHHMPYNYVQLHSQNRWHDKLTPSRRKDWGWRLKCEDGESVVKDSLPAQFRTSDAWIENTPWLPER